MTFQLASLHATARPGIPRAAAAAVYVVPMTGPEALPSLTAGQPAWGSDFSEFADYAALAAAAGSGSEGDFRYALRVLNGSTGGTTVDGTVTYNGVHTVKRTQDTSLVRGLICEEYVDVYASPWTGRQITDLWARVRLKADSVWTSMPILDVLGVPDATAIGAGIDVFGGATEFYVYDGTGPGTTNVATGATSLVLGRADFVDAVLRVRTASGGFTAQAWLIDPTTKAAVWSPGEVTQPVGTPPTGFVYLSAMQTPGVPASTRVSWWAGVQLVDGSAYPDPWNVLAAGL